MALFQPRKAAVLDALGRRFFDEIRLVIEIFDGYQAGIAPVTPKAIRFHVDDHCETLSDFLILRDHR